MNTIYSSTDNENFIIIDETTGACECYTAGTSDPIEKSKSIDEITIFSHEMVADILASDGIEQVLL